MQEKKQKHTARREKGQGERGERSRWRPSLFLLQCGSALSHHGWWHCTVFCSLLNSLGWICWKHDYQARWTFDLAQYGATLHLQHFVLFLIFSFVGMAEGKSCLSYFGSLKKWSLRGIQWSWILPGWLKPMSSYPLHCPSAMYFILTPS